MTRGNFRKIRNEDKLYSELITFFFFCWMKVTNGLEYEDLFSNGDQEAQVLVMVL